EGGLASLRVRRGPVARAELAVEDFQRERVLYHSLDRALERPRAVNGVVAPFGQQRFRRVGDLDRNLPIRQQALEALELDLDDVLDLLAPERIEDHDLVDAVQELGLEGLLER